MTEEHLDTDASTSTPILSLILCSRSDEYQGNSRWRLQTALNYLGATVDELGRETDVEAIVVDWGSRTPLSEIMSLTPQAAKITSYLYIPPDVAVKEQGDSPFPEVLALNAAMRRSSGQYVGRIDQDTLVGKYFLQTLFWLLETDRLLTPRNKAMFLSNRKRISVRYTAFSPELHAVQRYVNKYKQRMKLMDPPPPHLFYQSYVGIWLLHRDTWNECGGYDEHFIYMDWQEVDMMLRLKDRFTLINLGELTDHDLYHLDHGPARVAWSSKRDRKANPVRDLDRMPEQFYPNGANWGLNAYNLPLLAASPDLVFTTRLANQKGFFHWLKFEFLVLLSNLAQLGDRLILRLDRLYWILLAPSTWRSRAKVFLDTVRGKPILSWPILLLNRWVNRRSASS